MKLIKLIKPTALMVLLAFFAFTDLHAQSLSGVKKHVYVLASDSLSGRKTGTDDARRAAEYVATQFAEIGLETLSDTCDYFLPFVVSGSADKQFRNVVGKIEGNDPTLKNEYVIFGAHYDHLGKTGEVIYHGADDNASGTAALIEVARALKARQSELKRTVIIAAFDAEEIGLYGSTNLSWVIPPERIKLMVSMDMVGWLEANGKLEINGVATIRDGRRIVKSIERPDKLELDLKNFETFMFGATDTEGFAQRGVPTLHVTTGMKSPYHKPEDTADKVDYEGLGMVSDYMSSAAFEFATDESLASSGRLSFKHRQVAAFQGGAVAGIGSSRVLFPKAAVNGKSGFSYYGGVWCQFNFGRFGLRPEVVYEERKAKYPFEGSIFEGKNRITARNLTVPVMLVYRFTGNRGVNMTLDAGGYYSRNFRQMSDVYNLNEYGWSAGFTFNLYKYSIGYTAHSALSNMFEDKPKARFTSSYFTVRYMF